MEFYYATDFNKLICLCHKVLNDLLVFLFKTIKIFPKYVLYLHADFIVLHALTRGNSYYSQTFAWKCKEFIFYVTKFWIINLLSFAIWIPNHRWIIALLRGNPFCSHVITRNSHRNEEIFVNLHFQSDIQQT